MASGREPSPSAPTQARPTVGAGATLVLVSQLAIAASSWLTGVVVARALGPAGAGDFNVVMTLFLTLTTLSGLGLTFGASYYVSNLRWRGSDALRQLQLAALALGAVGALAGLGVVVLASDSAFRGISQSTVAIALAALPFALSWSFTGYVALGLDRYRMYVVGAAVQSFGSVALAAVLAPTIGLDGAVAAATLANVAGSLVPLAYGFRQLPAASRGWLRRMGGDVGRAFRFGVRPYFAVSLQFFNLRLDVFVLNAVAASATVGHYSVAVSLTQLSALLPRALSSVVLPRVASLDAAADHEQRHMVTVKSIRHTVLIVSVTAGALLVLVLAVPLIYGAAFSPAVALGLILIPGVTALGVSANLASIVTGRGRPDYPLYVALIVTPATVALYLVSVPLAGAVGAAVASTISYLSTLVLMLAYFRRATGIPISRGLLPDRAELEDYRALVTRVRGARRTASTTRQ